MRVAHVITRMIVGGAQENTLLNCLDLMREYGDQVLLITGPALGPEGDLLEKSRVGDLPIHLVPNLRRAINPYHDWRASAAVRDALREFRPDVVHTHSAKAGLLGRRAAWKLGVPAVVHTVHGAPFHPYQSPAARLFFARCERWAARYCHRMISVADAMTDLMVDSNVAPREKFTTIYSGMDVQPFLNADQQRLQVRARYGFEDQHVVIGKIARLFHLKGHEDLILAAKRVVQQCPDVRFLLVGDGILREILVAKIAELGLQDHFVFAGLVNPQEVPGLIGAMDVLVHTSYREGLARALPQALIAGRPVVSYDVDGAKEVAIPGETGFLVPPRDLKGLAEKLIYLAEDADARARMGCQGQQRFTQQFRHQTMTRLIRDLYRLILEGVDGPSCVVDESGKGS